MRVFILLAGAALSCYSVVITSGNLTVGGSSGYGNFTLNGDGFTMAGGHYPGTWSECYGCLPGTFYNTSYLLGELSALATVDGSRYSNWNSQSAASDSSLYVTAKPIQLTGPGVFSGVFEFSGHLCGYATPYPNYRPCDIAIPSLTGSGTYSLNVIAVSAPNFDRLQVTRADFTFGVPEPASVWTAAAGLAALAAIRSRNNQNSPPV